MYLCRAVRYRVRMPDDHWGQTYPLLEGKPTAGELLFEFTRIPDKAPMTVCSMLVTGATTISASRFSVQRSAKVDEVFFLHDTGALI